MSGKTLTIVSLLTICDQHSDLTRHTMNEKRELFQCCANASNRFVKRLENHLKKIDKIISLNFKRFNSNKKMNHLFHRKRDDYNRREILVDKLNLNFEYSFFKLLKSVLIDESLIVNVNELKSIMKFCLDKSIEQYNLIQGQSSPNHPEEYDEIDELNMIEL